MADTTLQTLNLINKAGKNSSQIATEDEKRAAFENGKKSAKTCIESGTAIMFLDEGQLFLSPLQLAEIMGWNSLVCSDKNQGLIKSRKL
jgi:hypothetical protein